LQKLPLRPWASPHVTPRAASTLTADGEALRDFSQEGQKIRRFDGSPRHPARNADQTAGGSANPHVSPSVLLIFL
jgi:hypothetical protein